MYIDPDQLGSDCMFINFDLAYHRAGDHEPSPCCKECKNQCEYICKRAAKEQDPVVIEPATPEPEYIETVNDTPEPDTKITEDEFVIAFYRFMYDSEKQLAQEKNSEQLRAELIKHYGKRYTNTNCILDGWTVCYPDKVVFRQNGNHTDQMQLSWGKVVSRLFKLIDEGRIVIFKPVNDDVNYTSENVDNELEIVNDVDEAVIEDKSCSNCKYNDMDPDEYRRGHLDKTIELPCNNCDDKLNHWEQKVDGLELDCFNEEEGWHKEIIINEPDPVETVTADIIQTVPDEQSKPKRPSIAGYMDDPYCPECKAGLIYKCDCLKCGCKIDWEPVKGLFEYEEEQLQKKLAERNQSKPESHEQPELPILKNNDQRKDFIDAYATWPIWIDQKETGERYYRYDLTDKVAMVVKVSLRHVWNHLTKKSEIEYSAPQYYLLGIKADYSTKVTFTEDDTRTFYECSSNMTMLVDYLKDIQKKGV
jgi:hypothetical protein